MRTTVALLVVLVLSTVSGSTAQTEPPSKTHLLMSAGVSLPGSPQLFRDYWSMGFGGGAGIEYAIGPVASIGGSVEYNGFRFDSEKFLAQFGFGGLGVEVSGGNISAVVVAANVKAMLGTTPGVATPYLTAGMGIMSVSSSDVVVTYQGSSSKTSVDGETAFGITGGAGLEIPAGSAWIFVEAKYGVGFTKGESTGIWPLRAGLKLAL
jgi:opacity protein-like surface antigen